MKNNQLAVMLAFVLLLSSLFSAFLTYRYTTALHQIERMSDTTRAVNTSMNLLQSLVNDTAQYSATHPAVVPILQSLSANNKAAAKPTQP
jgi:hypothetical protein